MLNQIVNSFFL